MSQAQRFTIADSHDLEHTPSRFARAVMQMADYENVAWLRNSTGKSIKVTWAGEEGILFHEMDSSEGWLAPDRETARAVVDSLVDEQSFTVEDTADMLIFA